MPTNKNALIRYKVLDNCFRNPGKRYFINDLITQCELMLEYIDPSTKGISRRQIYDDIAFMESDEGWGIELDRIRDGKRVFYRYKDISFSINNMPLNELEIYELKSTLSVLSQFKGMPQFEFTHEIIMKLTNGLNSKTSNSYIMEFDNNQYLKGLENLGALYNAIYYKKVLLIKYQPFDREIPYDITIHPYFLKQYNNRWFLFGNNPDLGKDDINLAIDRIVSFKELNTNYHENSVIDWEDYFEDIIGVTKPAESKVEDIVLQFSSKTAKYVETKPIHGSQKSKWINNDILEVKLQLIINYEFQRLLLSYADNVTVIKPIHLLKDIRDALKSAVENYEPHQLS